VYDLGPRDAIQPEQALSMKGAGFTCRTTDRLTDGRADREEKMEKEIVYERHERRGLETRVI